MTLLLSESFIIFLQKLLFCVCNDFFFSFPVLNKLNVSFQFFFSNFDLNKTTLGIKVFIIYTAYTPNLYSYKLQEHSRKVSIGQDLYRLLSTGFTMTPVIHLQQIHVVVICYFLSCINNLSVNLLQLFCLYRCH
jgi:hypothetical protein